MNLLAAKVCILLNNLLTCISIMDPTSASHSPWIGLTGKKTAMLFTLYMYKTSIATDQNPSNDWQQNQEEQLLNTGLQATCIAYRPNYCDTIVLATANVCLHQIASINKNT